ncbi:MAG: hypothetical protein OEU50_24180, partial [Gammaproteobacteria bacterium]|nr:hypothetical protein [Gammaproteobacteria bacterium]
RFVNDGEVSGVVEKAAIGVDFGIDACPEGDGAGNFRRAGKQILSTCSRRKRAPKQYDLNPSLHDSIHQFFVIF